MKNNITLKFNNISPPTSLSSSSSVVEAALAPLHNMFDVAAVAAVKVATPLMIKNNDSITVFPTWIFMFDYIQHTHLLLINPV